VLVLVAIVLAARRPRTTTVRVAILAMLVPLLAGAGLATLRLNELSSSGFIREAQRAKSEADASQAGLEQRLATIAATVCRGIPVPQAAPVSDPPRVVVVDDQGQLYGWDAVRDRGWAPKSVDDLQVVACLEPEIRSEETCRYTGGVSYELTRFQREIDVLRAADATALLDGSVFGANSDCDEAIVGGRVPINPESDHVDADAVLDSIEDVLPESGPEAS
jgi:hypothetical protein